MASLVADYGTSSGSDADSDYEVDRGKLPVSQPLAADSSSESENSSEDNDKNVEKAATKNVSSGDKNTCNRLPNPLSDSPQSSKLPPPKLDSKTSGSGSVFINQYKKAETKKLSILEQHVKMTVSNDEDDNKRNKKRKSKKICYSFIKGNCRYGHKCRFSHDLNSDSTTDNSQDSEDVSQSSNNSNIQNYGNQSWHEEVKPNVVDDDSYMAEAKRKKRVGVNDSMIPPKKALKQLEKQREAERPWTL